MIRAGRPDEASVIHDVVCAAYRHYIPRIGKPPGPMLDDYARRIAAGEVWALEEAGQIVGMLVLEEAQAGFVLDNIAVLPECQGKGYGRALLQFAEAEALRRRYREIHLYTHALMTENFALYRRIGYAETRRITENGYDRIYMSKHL